MFARKKKAPERLPWYRARGYKDDLTEQEKRELDSFRMREEHPAATFDSLSEEMQLYISRLEVENYDYKQGNLVMGCFLVSGIGAFFLARYVFGYAEESAFEYVWSLCMLILPWIYYPIKWKKNADEFSPPGDPGYAAAEAVRKEWELKYVANKRSPERHR